MDVAMIDYFTCTGKELYPYYVKFREGYFLESDYSFTQKSSQFQQFKGHKLEGVEGVLFGGSAVINGADVSVLSATGKMADKLAVMLWETRAKVKTTRLDIRFDEARRFDPLLLYGLACNPSMLKLYSSNGVTVYIGGKDRFVRVYDKTAESGLDIDVVRWECQLRHDRANACWGGAGKLWLEGHEQYYRYLAGVLNGELVQWGIAPLGEALQPVKIAQRIRSENWLNTQIMPYLVKMLTGTEFERERVLDVFNAHGLFLSDKLLHQDRLDEKLYQLGLDNC